MQLPPASIRAQLAEAHEFIAAYFRPQLAGVYAGDVPLLRVENNVGGTRFCVRLPRATQKRLFTLTCKNFHGTCTRIGLSEELAGQSAHGSALIFEPGSVQVVGAPSMHMLRLLLHRIGDVLRNDGMRPHMLFVSIDNRVATGNFGFPIALERMHGCIPDFLTSYYPNKFPGLICIHQPDGQQFVMMLFESGKATALGLPSPRIANEIFLRMMCIASANKINASVAQQKRKSKERMARMTGETNAREVDSTRESRRIAGAKRIGKAIAEYMEKNKHLRGTPDFERTMRADIDRLVAGLSEIAVADDRGKRRRVDAPAEDKLVIN